MDRDTVERHKRRADMAVAAIGALTKAGKLLPEKVSGDDIARGIHALTAERDALWVLLDDIDTASDIYKDDYQGLAKRVYELQQKRHTIIDGDSVLLSVAKRSGLTGT